VPRRWGSCGDGGRDGLTGAILAAADRVVVRLVKLGGTDDYEYPMVVLADDGTHIVVRGPWAEPEARRVGPVTFEPGDVFTEHYWRDRWYAVKEVCAAGGALKGWYCDVTRPTRVESGVIVSEDLVLDLWVDADGRSSVRLDEDEFEASGLEMRDPAVARRAREALDTLARLAGDGWDTILD
jgi:hypothetical protein